MSFVSIEQKTHLMLNVLIWRHARDWETDGAIYRERERDNSIKTVMFTKIFAALTRFLSNTLCSLVPYAYIYFNYKKFINCLIIFVINSDIIIGIDLILTWL